MFCPGQPIVWVSCPYLLKRYKRITKFGNKVKFLVTNEYQQEDTKIIESSRYLRSLIIQQAKSLVENSPGAAQKLLTSVDNLPNDINSELNNYINFFNIVRNDENDEFSIPAASQRIIDVLELINIYFKQQNYLQGITLLSAAQETFMKVAILKKIEPKKVNLNQQKVPATKYIIWDTEGLKLNGQLFTANTEQQRKDILKQLQYPDFKLNKLNLSDKTKCKIDSNSAMLEWIKNLEPNFKVWSTLEWSCKHFRDRENDLRNQLMHNLKGIKEEDVIKYLYGFQDTSSLKLTKTVAELYNQKVKQPFEESMKLFELPFQAEKISKKLKNFADSLDQIS